MKTIPEIIFYANIILVFLFSINGCSEDDAETPLIVENFLYITVTDTAAGTVNTLFKDSLIINLNDNNVDFRDRAIHVPVNKTNVTKLELKPSNNKIYFLDFFIYFPSVTQLPNYGHAHTTINFGTPREISSMALFNVSLIDSVLIDSIPLSLYINNEPIFEDSLFIFDNIHLQNAIHYEIPLIQQVQNVSIVYSPYYCYNSDENVYSMFLINGKDLYCGGVNYQNMNREFNLLAFFANLPVEQE